MRKLKEILRLRYELGLGQRQIARSCSIGHGTVYEYLKHAQAAGVRWPLPEGWDDRQLEEALFGPAPRRPDNTRTGVNRADPVIRGPHKNGQWSGSLVRPPRHQGHCHFFVLDDDQIPFDRLEIFVSKLLPDERDVPCPRRWKRAAVLPV